MAWSANPEFEVTKERLVTRGSWEMLVSRDSEGTLGTREDRDRRVSEASRDKLVPRERSVVTETLVLRDHVEYLDRVVLRVSTGWMVCQESILRDPRDTKVTEGSRGCLVKTILVEVSIENLILNPI